MTLHRTTADHEAFRHLVQLLDAHLAVTDEDEHDFYHQYNGLEHIRHVVLAEVDGRMVACGAFKEYSSDTVEIKRMYTLPEHRGAGIAVAVLEDLEAWATALGYRRGVLETGVRQPYAIRLYEKQGYQRMAENYGQYAGVANSVCLEKMLVE